MKKLAESKLVKLGEPLTDNAEGDPELSLKVEESVQTRRRVCKKCSKELPRRRQLYCSDKCRSAYLQQRWKIKHSLIEKPGVGSGGNQLREKNHQWKNGKATFQKIAFEYYDHICKKCGSTDYLCVHHKDHDRLNNNLSNLMILCKSCHQKHHTTRDQKTGRYIKG